MGIFDLLPAQTDKFRLGNLHGLRNAVAANGFDIIRDNVADVQNDFLVGPGTV